jgi:hypothetical protein
MVPPAPRMTREQVLALLDGVPRAADGALDFPALQDVVLSARRTRVREHTTSHPAAARAAAARVSRAARGGAADDAASRPRFDEPLPPLGRGRLELTLASRGADAVGMRSLALTLGTRVADGVEAAATARGGGGGGGGGGAWGTSTIGSGSTRGGGALGASGGSFSGSGALAGGATATRGVGWGGEPLRSDAPAAPASAVPALLSATRTLASKTRSLSPRAAADRTSAIPPPPKPRAGVPPAAPGALDLARPLGSIAASRRDDALLHRYVSSIAPIEVATAGGRAVPELVANAKLLRGEAPGGRAAGAWIAAARASDALALAETAALDGDEAAAERARRAALTALTAAETERARAARRAAFDCVSPLSLHRPSGTRVPGSLMRAELARGTVLAAE